MSDHLGDEQLSRLIDGDLPPMARTAALDHLHACTACALRHDTLVEGVAGLRTGEPFTFTALAQLETMERLGAGGRRRLSPGSVATTVLTAVSLIAVGLVIAPLLHAGLGLARVAFTPVSWFAPGGLAAPGHALVALIAIALLGPLLAYPLMRWR
jgi:anti-sigma factor RsiW